MIELLELLDDVLKKKINISDFLDALILDALKSRASDIHIESKIDILLVRYRVDGVLRDIISIGPELKESLLFIIKVRAKLRTDVHLAPQDGKILFLIKKSDIEGEESKEEEKKGKEENQSEVIEEKVEKEEDKTEKKGKKDDKEAEEKPLNRLEVYKSQEKDTYNVDARVSILPVSFGESCN